jgi:hypothetical protein
MAYRGYLELTQKKEMAGIRTCAEKNNHSKSTMLTITPSQQALFGDVWTFYIFLKTFSQETAIIL